MKTFNYVRMGSTERGTPLYSRNGKEFPWLTRPGAREDAAKEKGKAVFGELIDGVFLPEKRTSS
jgi:hypothetical protein